LEPKNFIHLFGSAGENRDYTAGFERGPAGQVRDRKWSEGIEEGQGNNKEGNRKGQDSFSHYQPCQYTDTIGRP